MPARLAIRSTLEREHCQRSCSSLGETYSPFAGGALVSFGRMARPFPVVREAQLDRLNAIPAGEITDLSMLPHAGSRLRDGFFQVGNAGLRHDAQQEGGSLQ